MYEVLRKYIFSQIFDSLLEMGKVTFFYYPEFRASGYNSL